MSPFLIIAPTQYCPPTHSIVPQHTQYTQVYSIVMDLVSMYEHYRSALPLEDANRLLAIARPPPGGS